MDHVEVDGLRIAYRRRGSGVPLVLLHGAVCDSRVWRVELERFAEASGEAAFDVVAWDAPGCGGSSDAPDVVSMADYASVLERFMDAVGVEVAHVLGHSWGSTLAFQLCLQAPTRVRSLTIVGGYAGWAGSLPPDEVERRLAFALDSAEHLPRGFDPTSMPGLFSDAMPADRAQELARIMSDIRAPATRSMARALAASDLRSALSDIEVPTLVVVGEQDLRSPVGVARALHAALSNSTLTVLPGVGHECHLEDAETFATVVLGHLEAAAA